MLYECAGNVLELLGTRAGFFYKSYERRFYFFEAIDMLRKFLLVAGLAVLEPGSTTQLMLAQLVCLGFLTLVLNWAPYKKEAVDFTNQASLAVPSGAGCCFSADIPGCASERTAQQVGPSSCPMLLFVVQILSVVASLFRPPTCRSWCRC